MLNRLVLRFIAFWSCVWVALSCTGCAKPEIIPTASYLPSSAQVERERQLLAIPPDLQEKLTAVIARLGPTAQVGANRQFIGQMPSPEMILRRELLKTVLGWAHEKTPAERLQEQAEVMQRQSEGVTLEDWRVQRAAGTVAGAAIGAVPLGPYAADVAIELKVLPQGTYHAQVGKACGEIISGVVQMVWGCGGVAGGTTVSGTGAGAVAGIPLVAGSVLLVANGYATAVHGLDEAQRLWSEGPPADEVPRPVSEEPLLKPKAKPEQPAPVAAPAAPAQTRTTTRNKTTGVTESHSESGTSTTTTPKKAPGQEKPPAPTEKRVPNPNGKKGGPEHRAKVAEVAKDIDKRGLEPKTEYPVETKGGHKDKRYMDVAGLENKKPVEFHQVGKQRQDGKPVSREVKALDDVAGATGQRPTFHPYNQKK